MLKVTRILLFKRPIQAKGEERSSLPEKMVFRPLLEVDFARDPIFREKERYLRYRGRLEDGHRCFGFVTESSEVAFYLWVSGPVYGTPNAPFEGGLSCAISDDVAYIWDCRTAANWQRRGLYQSGLRRVIAFLAQDDVKSAAIVCSSENEPSARGITKAGFVLAERLTIWTLLRRFALVVSDLGVRANFQSLRMPYQLSVL